MFKLLQRCSLFFFSLAISLITSELALRITHPSASTATPKSSWAIIPEESWIEYHPTLGWFQQTNKHAFLKKNSLLTAITTNSIGLRTKREFSPNKPFGKLRLYLVGDSFTFGFGVKDDETISSQLEFLDSKLEVFNLGVPGYGVDQFFLLIKEFGFGFSPDFVFILIYPEDFWRSLRAYNDAGYAKPYFTLESGGDIRLHNVPVPKEKNSQTPQFPELIQTHPFPKWITKTMLYQYTYKAVTRIQKLLGKEDPDTSPEWLLGRAILSKAVEEIQTHKAKPVIVIVPPERWLTGTIEPIRDSLIRFGTRYDVPVIDLTPKFQNAIKESDIHHYYIPDDIHWTAKGNRLAAETILNFLSQT